MGVCVDGFQEREEGGTPDVLGVIRAGLVFQVSSEFAAMGDGMGLQAR